MPSIDSTMYHRLYGPVVGDRVRLADTDLFLRVPHSYIPLGEEGLIGAGRNIRDSMLFHSTSRRTPGMDVCIKHVLIIDPVSGVHIADIGIRDGRIIAVGHIGNPDLQDGVDFPLDSGTAVFPGAGLIATPGLIDTHAHLSSDILDCYLELGYTTLIGAGAGMRFDAGTNPRWLLERMLYSLGDYPVNVAYLSLGSSSRNSLEEILHWGASGFKIHEDVGAYPSVIDCALQVAEDYDIQVMLHTDSINEAGNLNETISAIGGRTVHAYHVEGAGGGHAPDILEIVSHENVLPSSTTPTNPFTAGAIFEHADMIMSGHLLDPQIAEDLAFAQSRVRPETMAAEDVLHDIGAISMIGSDSVGMGRAGESFRRALQLAHVMKRGNADPGADDNDTILRYLAKVTINPAIAHGIDAHVGSVQPGKLADLVLWKPAYFGVKPEFVFKSGMMTYSNFGMSNGALPYVQPMALRRAFGNGATDPFRLGRLFVAQATIDNPAIEPFKLRGSMLAVRGARNVGKLDMVRNDALPSVRVDPDTFTVRVDGVEIEPIPADNLPLNRRYWLL